MSITNRHLGKNAYLAGSNSPYVTAAAAPPIIIATMSINLFLFVKSETKSSVYLLHILLFGGVHDIEQVDDPPDVKSTTGYKLAYSKSNVTDSKSVNAK